MRGRMRPYPPASSLRTGRRDSRATSRQRCCTGCSDRRRARSRQCRHRGGRHIRIPCQRSCLVIGCGACPSQARLVQLSIERPSPIGSGMSKRSSDLQSRQNASCGSDFVRDSPSQSSARCTLSEAPRATSSSTLPGVTAVSALAGQRATQATLRLCGLRRHACRVLGCAEVGSVLRRRRLVVLSRMRVPAELRRLRDRQDLRTAPVPMTKPRVLRFETRGAWIGIGCGGSGNRKEERGRAQERMDPQGRYGSRRMGSWYCGAS